MTTVTTYIAFDGKKFDSKQKCMDYEFQLKGKKFEDSALLFNGGGKQLPLTYDGMSKCAYMVCRTDEAAQFVFNEFHSNFDLPWSYGEDIDAGAWTLNNDDEWEDLKEYLKDMEIAQQIAKLI